MSLMHMNSMKFAAAQNMVMHYSPSGGVSTFFLNFSFSLMPTFLKQMCIIVPHREKELAAVKINAADADIIANELEVTFLVPSSLNIPQ
uniref:Uncharacterized protein n=1 Tax=Rhizophora mucronata TaxID=61149 RepID=A0A2P2KG40_RHIMU